MFLRLETTSSIYRTLKTETLNINIIHISFYSCKLRIVKYRSNNLSHLLASVLSKIDLLMRFYFHAANFSSEHSGIYGNFTPALFNDKYVHNAEYTFKISNGIGGNLLVYFRDIDFGGNCTDYIKVKLT